MEICKRIKSLRISKGLTQHEVGEVIGVSDVSVRAWEAGTKQPSASAIIALSKTFNVPADYILGISSQPDTDLYFEKDERELVTNYRQLDIYGKRTVSTVCVLEKQRIEDSRGTKKHHTQRNERLIPLYYTPAAAGMSVPLDGEDFELIPCSDTVAHADFAVRIQGASMMPYIHDGDIVYVEKDKEISVGDVGIFCVDGAMYCKQFFVDNEGNMALLSANPALKSTNVYISSDSGSVVKCYGKVMLDYHIPLSEYPKEYQAV